jgi:hypothetical protein
VKHGETLTSIAAKRKGLSIADLAWLNDMTPDQPLAIGQRLRLPNQSYLNAGREARNEFVALSHYMDTHDGALPADVANPPSIDVQIEAAGVRTITKNDYDFDVDVLERTRRIRGQLRLKPERRSRREQRHAGKPDRLPNDDGGHYIAARFNGPRERFNHFAQDRNFNRGAYRTVEDQWAKALGAGKRVFVDIVPQYKGLSRRPYSLNVVWYVDGERFSESFPNQEKGK